MFNKFICENRAFYEIMWKSIYLLEWWVCWERYELIRHLASWYLWLSDVEEIALRLNK